MSSRITAKFIKIIEGLNEDQLGRVNSLVIERLKLIRRSKELNAVAQFKTGDQVSYDNYGEKKIGKIIRLNQRSVTVKFKDGAEWLIDPYRLKKK